MKMCASDRDNFNLINTKNYFFLIEIKKFSILTLSKNVETVE